MTNATASLADSDGAAGIGEPIAWLARRLVDGDALPDGLAAADPLALAWALRDLCYASWSTDPQRSANAADALQTILQTVLRTASRQHVPGDALPEIGALADWTAGIAHITRGRMDDAVQALDRAADAFAALDRANLATQTQVPKIMALSMLGRHDDAVTCAEGALARFATLGDAGAAGRVGLNLGALHVRRGAYAEAAAHSRRAAVHFARAGDHEHSIMADVNMADALTSLGDFDEAMRIYARARMRAVAHGFPVLHALADESIGLVQLARGHYRDALANLEASRRRYEHLAMPQPLAIAEKQLADAYLELRLLPEALALFDQALARFRALSMPHEEAWTLVQRGRVQTGLGRPAEAAASFADAATLFVRRHDRVGGSTVALARAEAASLRGDDAAALADARDAAAGFTALGLTDGRLRARVVEGDALLALGRVDDARHAFDATLDEARALQLLSLEVRCLTGLGLVARIAGDRAAARIAFCDAVERFEEQRRALPWDDLRSASLGHHLHAYEALLRMALEDQARDGTAVQADAVLMALDRYRARSLGERLGQQASRPVDAVADDEADALRERLRWLHRQARRADEDGESSASLSDEARQTERALLERSRRTRLAAPTGAEETGTATPDADGFTVAALQSALEAGDALIEYGVVDDELFACVVTYTAVSIHRRLGARGDVQEALHAANFQIQSLRHGAVVVARHLDLLEARAQRRMAALHRMVWAPLVEALVGVERVIVVPGALLGTLAFAALGADGVDARPVGARYELAVAASARLALHGLRRRPVPSTHALVLAESSRLPNAGDEARHVAALFADGRACIDADATLDALRRHAAAADVVHFACHAEFRADSPMFSALHLHDGPLAVETVESLVLKPAIVVLSACDTGRAESADGDERIGLVRAFVVAGAARVVASLWPVGDAVAMLFMQHFYEALHAHRRPAAALRVAQAAVRALHPHPFHWAAFTLHGGW